MTDYNTLRSVISEITDKHISLEERDRLANSEELLHLSTAYKEIKHAAHTSDAEDVWDELDAVEELITTRLETIDWRDDEK